jgi:pyruvate dehydrogenase E2 component (dihydrolipoamide acetyltransferase)
MDFRLPALGEGIEMATVTAVLVKPGDAVKAGQAVLSVETDKAAMEVEADVEGTVEQVLVKPGDKLPIGGPVLKLAGVGKGETPKSPPFSKETRPKQEPARAEPAKAEPAKAEPAKATTTQAGGGQKVEFRLPPLGEGIEAATVTAVLVKPGDAVKVGQGVLSVETDKAAMEVESDVAGTVEQVLVKSGAKLSIGSPVLTLNSTSTTAVAPPREAAPAAQAAPAKSFERATASAPAADGIDNHRSPHVTQFASENGTATKVVIPAGPATRRLARELGVSLTEVKGTGRGGRVTLDDVKAFVRDERKKVKEGGAPVGGSIVNVFALPALPDFSKFGALEVKELASIRQTIAKNLTIGWRTMPMVTQHDLADITDLEAGRKRIVDALPKGSPKITMTILAIKACIAALKEFPHFNSSYDMNSGKLILKKYYHIGIAVDTERGLVVPVIKDADKKTIRDLAAEVATLAEKARSGKLAIDEMRGGTFTITNLGGIGGTAFTPLVNYPEVAILGLSRSNLQPVVRDGQIVARLMMPLSLTYDHRVIDGADGCRFTVRLAQLFSDPLRLLMET